MISLSLARHATQHPFTVTLEYVWQFWMEPTCIGGLTLLTNSTHMYMCMYILLATANDTWKLLTRIECYALMASGRGKAGYVCA